MSCSNTKNGSVQSQVTQSNQVTTIHPEDCPKKLTGFISLVHNKHTQTVQNSMVSMCRILRKLTNHVTDKNQKRVKRSNKILIVGAQTQSWHSVPNLNVNFSNLHGQINFIYIFLHVPVLLSACYTFSSKNKYWLKGFNQPHCSHQERRSRGQIPWITGIKLNVQITTVRQDTLQYYMATAGWIFLPIINWHG